MSAGACGGHKRALDPLKLEFQVGTRWSKWALEPNIYLFEHSKQSSPLSHFFSPEFIFLKNHYFNLLF